MSSAKLRQVKSGAIAAGLLIGMGLLVWWIWPDGDNSSRPRRVVQEINVVQPPPPLPEPEEEVVEEEPEVVEPPEEAQVQEDVETPVEEPTEQPSEEPSNDASPTPTAEAAGLDRPADVGSDSFRLSAGKGGGLFGRGGGGGSWGGFVETHIRRALQSDPRTRAASGFVRVVVRIDPNGRFTNAELRSSTGDPKLDEAIEDVLSGLDPLGRGRPSETEGLTYATINMKRVGG